MKHGHYIKRCSVDGCGKVLGQCRCPGPKEERTASPTLRHDPISGNWKCEHPDCDREFAEAVPK